MRDRLDDLGDDTDVVLITFTDPDNLTSYAQRNQVPFTMLIDPDRAAYRAFGLGRGSIGRVWGWRAARRYVEIIRDGGLSRVRRPVEDTRQLGGNFIVSADGTLLYGFWGSGPDDRPSVDELVTALSG